MVPEPSLPPSSQKAEPPPSREEIDLYRSEMAPRLGLLVVFFRIFFRHITSDERALAQLRDVAKQGTVVHVMRNRSVLDYVFFNDYFRRNGIPLARFANGINMIPWLPLSRAVPLGFRKLRESLAGRPAPDPVDSGFLRRLVGSGQTALVFLRRRGTWLFRRPQRSKADLIEELIRAQDQSDRPIFLVPETLVWQRRPDRADPGLLGMVLGQGEDPGRVWKLFHFLFFHRHAVVRIGEAINLAEFLAEERQKGTPIPTIARKLYRLLRGYLYREEKLVKGPAIMPRGRMFERVLADPRVAQVLTEVAEQEGKPREAIARKAWKTLDKTAADFRYVWILVAKTILDVVFQRIYSGVEFDEEDSEKIRKAARRGTVVFIPCHRSHLDYILISWCAFQQHIQPPHIAAGINLSFWPAGPFLRRCGAFFIKRSFKGDALYEVLLTGYVRELTRQGYTQEFFIEGGRSRTGKLLRPRVGLLGMYMDAAADRLGGDVLFVPMALGYEKVAEEKEYFRELTGGEKKKEDLAALARTTTILGRRFGRVYVKAGEAISARETIEALEKPYDSLDGEERRSLLGDLGERLIHAIHEVTVVTPSAVAATVLLSHERRGIPLPDFRRRSQLLVEFLLARGAIMSRAMAQPEKALSDGIRQFAGDRLVELFDPEHEEQSVIAIPEEKRLTLDYYKNNIVNHFAGASMYALALRSGDGEAMAEEAIRERFVFLHHLFAEEFTQPPGRTEEDAFAQAQEELMRAGVVEKEEGGLGPASQEKLRLFAAILVNFLESYRVVIRALQEVEREGRPQPEKILVKRALAEGRKMFMTEDVTRRESLSKVTFENATRQMRRKGVLVLVPGGDGHYRIDRDRLNAFAEGLKVLALE